MWRMALKIKVHLVRLVECNYWHKYLFTSALSRENISQFEVTLAKVDLSTTEKKEIKRSEYVSSLHVSIRKIHLSVQYSFLIMDWDFMHISSKIRALFFRD